MPFPSMDEGDLAIKCYVKNNKMILAFGKDLSWLGFNKSDVEALIAMFQEKLEEMQ